MKKQLLKSFVLIALLSLGSRAAAREDSEGMRFTDWFSACSVCAPSRTVLLTGRYPQRCGLPVCPERVAFGASYRDTVGLQPSEVTIAERRHPPHPLPRRPVWGRFGTLNLKISI